MKVLFGYSKSEQLAGNPSAEIVAQSGLPKKLYSTQGTQTDEPNQMNDEANVGTFIDEMYELHLVIKIKNS